ncbi:MAG: DUF1858 domain-containing protein [Bacteroidales bacterium]|nr:DUF1858 domain-containing protein [Bacteroidales bacterium]
MNKYINTSSKLLEITEQYPETIKIFSDNGFPQMSDKARREQFGKSLSLDMALTLKQMNKEAFVNTLEEAIAQSRGNEDASLNDASATPHSDIKITGLLPCPCACP